jgi:predicted nuclease of predicted toxin-antitoxin system
MKLLFDQNISFRIVAKLSEIFPGSEQVRRLMLENRKDRLIWEYARSNGFTIVSCDTDFYDLSCLHGHPPKVIWVRMHNPSTEELAIALRLRMDIIIDFINSPAWAHLSCLEIK